MVSIVTICFPFQSSPHPRSSTISTSQGSGHGQKEVPGFLQEFQKKKRTVTKSENCKWVCPLK